MSIERSIEEILIDLDQPPARIVSLVPSYTESLFDLGFGKWVVGITDYCTYPPEAVAKIQRVGGVYNPRVKDILGLSPDLVIANQEENKPETIHSLSEAGIKVWLTFPKTVEEMFDVLVGMVALYHDEQASLRVRMLETALDWAGQSAGQAHFGYFVPIWQECGPDGSPWWMTFNGQTYSSDLLNRLGGRNVFADRLRRYPLEADLGLAKAEPAGGRDERYPRVTVAEVIAAQPELIFLPDEPFDFSEPAFREMMALLCDTPAVQSGRIYRIDGSLLAWCGTRIGKSVGELAGYFQG